MSDTEFPTSERQPAYDAVFKVIRRYPGTAERNGVVWRAVTAALDAMEPVWQDRADAKQAKAYEQARLQVTSAITSFTNMANGMIERGDGTGAVVLAATRSMEDVRDLIDEATGQNPLQVLARIVSERGER